MQFIDLRNNKHSMSFYRHHPFRFLFDERMTQANEFGLIKKWESDFKITVHLPKSSEINASSNDDPLIIVLKVIILLEVVLSAIIFLCEILWHYYDNDYRFFNRP